MRHFRRLPVQMGAAFVAGVLVSLAGAVSANNSRVVSQAGRMFTPGEMTIKRGETIQILNDDGDLLHHVYVDAGQLNFDSGDQKPGSKTNITFPTTGDFTLLCAIHPKMKLIVRVR